MERETYTTEATRGMPTSAFSVDEFGDCNAAAEESNNGKRVPRVRKTHKQRIVSTGNRRAQRKLQRQAKAKGRR